MVICHVLTALEKSPYIELQDYQEEPFGSHSFSFPQNTLGSKKDLVSRQFHICYLWATLIHQISSQARLTCLGLEFRPESHWRNVQKLCRSATNEFTAMWFVLLRTLVVFDGKIGVVEHLWDQTIVKIVALDWVVFVHRTDSLDHLCWDRKKQQRARSH